MYIPVGDWLPAFLITLAVELPIVAVLLRSTGLGMARVVGIAAIANLATHPVVWFVLPQLFEVGQPQYVLAAEGWAVVVEAACYWLAFPGIGLRRAAVTAIVANASSWLVGRVIGADLGMLLYG